MIDFRVVPCSNYKQVPDLGTYSHSYKADAFTAQHFGHTSSPHKSVVTHVVALEQKLMTGRQWMKFMVIKARVCCGTSKTPRGCME